MSQVSRTHRVERDAQLRESLKRTLVTEPESERQALLDADPNWQKCRTNPTYLEIERRYKAALGKLKQRLERAPEWHEMTDDQECRKWLLRGGRVREWYGVDERSASERADTPDRLLRFLMSAKALAFMAEDDAVLIEKLDEARQYLIRIRANNPSLPSMPVQTANPLVDLTTLQDWCVTASNTQKPSDLAGPKDDELVKRSEVARRLKIGASAVTRFVAKHKELAEKDERASKVYLEQFRTTWDTEHSIRQRDSDNRARTEQRVNRDTRKAEKMLADGPRKQATQQR